jgi:hypothetical protein
MDGSAADQLLVSTVGLPQMLRRVLLAISCQAALQKLNGSPSRITPTMIPAPHSTGPLIRTGRFTSVNAG